MDSFYLLDGKDQVLLEHNWKGRSLRSVVDAFVVERQTATADDAAAAATHGLSSSLPPVLALSGCLVFHIVTGTLTMLCVTSTEIEAAYVLEMLHRIAHVFVDYFGTAAATTELLSNHFDTVTELLCEVVHNGYPLTTEANGIRDMVASPSLLSKLINVTGMQAKFEGQGQISGIPWRRAKVKYTNNEIFVDVRESLTAIVDKHGRFVYADIAGMLHCTTKLSGVPEVALTLKPAALLGSPLFHPSVDLAKYDAAPGTLSYIPPDGAFALMSYTTELSTTSSSPLPCSIHFTHGAGPDAFDVVLTTRSNVAMDPCVIEIPLPSSCHAVRVAATRGEHAVVQYASGPSPITIRWLVSAGGSKGRESGSNSSNNRMVLHCTNTPLGLKSATCARLVTLLPTQAISGLTVDSLKMHRVGDWKPYKGVKYMTQVDVSYRAA